MPDCGAELKHLKDVSEILEYVPARFKVIRQARAVTHRASGSAEPFHQTGVAAVCLYLWRRRDLFEEQARNQRVGTPGRGGHNDMDMT